MLTTLAAATAAEFQGGVLQLVSESGTIVKMVLLVLLGFSVLAWAVIIERWRSLKRAETTSAAFLHDLETERRLTDLAHRADRYSGSPLVPVFHAGFREMTGAISEAVTRYRGAGGMPERERERIVERVRRRLEESAAAESDQLDRHLGVLATTGSVTPFIGLFGTVWGIMNAFQGIGVAGSASLAAVAPGISEALVTTAAGLAAAIPAVVAYNILLARARRLGGRLDRFVLTFQSLAEQQIEAGRSAAAAVEAGGVRL